jgi:hypothetical protein
MKHKEFLEYLETLLWGSEVKYIKRNATECVMYNYNNRPVAAWAFCLETWAVTDIERIYIPTSI